MKNIKKQIFLLLSFLLCILGNSNAQISITYDGSASDSSAMLDIKSTDRGFLLPRMTAAQRDAIADPALGLISFVTNDSTFYLFDGNNWVKLLDANNSPEVWTKNGNFVYKLNDSIGIGTSTPAAKLDVNGNIVQSGLGNSVFIGLGAGENDDLSNNRNVFIGSSAGTSNTIGWDNVAMGYNSFSANTSGRYNLALGSGTLQSNTTGWENSAVGEFALRLNTDGKYNVGMGGYALYSNTDGDNNTAVGYAALVNNETGSENVAVGKNAMENNITGIQNTAIGSDAGPSVGNLFNTTAIGNNTTVTASNTIHLGNVAITEIAGQVGFSTYSDMRFKNNIKQDVAGLNFIMKLRPVTYNWDIDKLDAFLGNEPKSTENFLKAKEKQQSIVYGGFLAQEVEQAAKMISYDFSGVVIPQNENSIYSLRYAEFVVPLVKAVQELAVRNDQLTEKVGEQQKMMEEQSKMIEQLQQENSELKKIQLEIEELKKSVKILQK